MVWACILSESMSTIHIRIVNQGHGWQKGQTGGKGEGTHNHWIWRPGHNRIQRRNSRFFTISSLRHEPSPTRTLKWPWHSREQITCDTSSAYHVQHGVLRATWYEGTARLLSLTELKSHLFVLFLLAELLTDEGGGKPEYPEKTPATSFKKCHIRQS